MGHREVAVKVNAYVDAGIAPLVAALNHFDGVWTIDSCERDGDGAAYVYFSRLGGGKQLSAFVDDLSAALGARIDSTEYELRVEWVAGTETPIAKLTAHPACLASIAPALRSLANGYRRNESRRGKDGRALRS